MTVVCLTSATGAPGVTTSTLALAWSWPRPVLVIEADMVGTSNILAGYLRGSRPHDRGLINLAIAHRHGLLSPETVLSTAVPLHPDSRVLLLPGLSSPVQRRTMPALWPALVTCLAALHNSGTDVLVDAGRLGTEGAPDPLLSAADVLLVVLRSDLPSVAGARAHVEVMRDAMQGTGTADTLALLVVGEGRPYSTREIARTVATPVLAGLAWDPRSAAVFSHGEPLPGATRMGRVLSPRRGPALVQSAAMAGAAIRARSHARLADLAVDSASGGGRG